MEQKEIRQPVINSFNRAKIPYQELLKQTEPQYISNRFTGEGKNTTALLAYLVNWIYQTNNDYEMGKMTVSLSDFDRIKYFILEQDSQLYSLCID